MRARVRHLLSCSSHSSQESELRLNVGGRVRSAHGDGAHTRWDSKYLLCHLEQIVCKCVNCLIILPPDQTKAFSLSSTKAQVPVDLAHEPCLATRAPGCCSVILSGLDLRRERDRLWPYHPEHTGSRLRTATEASGHQALRKVT